jgi:enoyl-CoA hydratase/carnithine racemase
MSVPTRGYGDLVLMEKKDSYGIITLNRPEKRNALNLAAQAELRAALEDAREDCKVLVITGAGTMAFCSGVDLSERRAAQAGEPGRRPAWGGDSWFETQEVLLHHPAILIAAVNGYALGGGLTLVNNCEMAVASETAQFGMPEMGFAAFPALAGPSTMHRILPKHAAYMVFTAERINARTAERWGIVNELVDPAKLLPRAEELARRIAQFDAMVLDYSKKALREIPSLDWTRSLDYGVRTGMLIRSQARATGSDDE